MWPVNQALYPKMAQLAQSDPGGTLKTVRLSLLFLGGLGLVFGLAIFLGAPLFVHLALGPAFRAAVPVLRVFSLWIPLTGLCTVITFQVILPGHLDSQFNIVNFTAALVNIFAALLLAPRFGAIGIAWSAVIGQSYTLLAFAVVLWRAGLNPFPLSMATAVHPRPVG
jgi:PST family polysaccharide transporter